MRIPNFIRLIAAGLFVWASILGLVGLAGALWPETMSGPATGTSVMAGLGFGLLMFVLSLVTVVLFNRGGWSYVSGKDPGALVREWEENGLLDSSSYRAIRAFQVEEYGDEGLTFFLELDDHTVLYLNGQYLYEYEEIVDDVEAPIPRRFPNTEFIVRTYRPGAYVVDLICSGEAFEPEVVTSHSSDWGVLDDHTVITSKSYEELKAERLARQSSHE